MRLSDLEGFQSITIQCHDNPDADAIGAGFGLYSYFQSKGCDVRLIYSGTNRIKKSNLKLLIRELEIPIQYVPVNGREKIDGLLLTVDCQYGSGNVTRFEAERVATIDHHPLEGRELEHLRVEQNRGSCASLVWSMLQEEDYPVNEDVRMGTALYYGLYMDTNQFSELFNPLDMDMREEVTVDKHLITRLRNSNISLSELEIAGIAMIRYNYNDDYRFAVIKSKPCDPNILGLISDFLLQVDVVDTCVVYNQLKDGYKLSVRSCIREVNANELAAYLTEGIGSGGGHNEKAGGFISMKLYEEKYPTLHSEAYFNNRMTEYFDSFEILSSAQMKMDVSRMTKYARVREPLLVLKITDAVRKGARFSVRTGKENMEGVASEQMYLAIERDGVVHPMPEQRFLVCLENTGKRGEQGYFEDSGYIPTIRDWTEDRLYKLEDYATLCVPTEAFQIYAMPLDSYVKLFPEWDEDKYMLGKPGDYLAVSADNRHNAFIEPGDKFSNRFLKRD